MPGFARNLGFEIVCAGRHNFFTPIGSGYRVILIGICVSTRDFKAVGWMINIGRRSGLPDTPIGGDTGVKGCPRFCCIVEFLGDSNGRPAWPKFKFGDNVGLSGEPVFIVIPPNVSSKPDDGEGPSQPFDTDRVRPGTTEDGEVSLESP